MVVNILFYDVGNNNTVPVFHNAGNPNIIWGAALQLVDLSWEYIVIPPKSLIKNTPNIILLFPDNDNSNTLWDTVLQCVDHSWRYIVIPQKSLIKNSSIATIMLILFGSSVD